MSKDSIQKHIDQINAEHNLDLSVEKIVAAMKRIASFIFEAVRKICLVLAKHQTVKPRPAKPYYHYRKRWC